MRLAGSASGAYVYDISAGKQMFAWRAGTPRILASNTKLFTSAAALTRFGTDGTLGTEVLGDGQLDGRRRLAREPLPARRRRPDLRLQHLHAQVLRRRRHGPAARQADRRRPAIERVTGHVYGDESRHDSLRGGPDSGYGVSIWVGPLSALSYNRGLATEGGSAFQTNPPAFAAARLDDALEARGIKVKGKPAARTAPGGLDVLASVDSPPMARIIKLMNKPSDNFFAEMLAKDVAMQVNGRGTTSAGAALIAGFARRLGSGAQLVDGSGLCARQPRLALPRGPAAARDVQARAGAVGRLHRLALDRRQRRHADGSDAARPGPRPLPRQDGHAVRRQRAVGLLRGHLRATPGSTRS